MSGDGQITTAEQAASDGRVMAFGWLQGAANRLEYILGRAIEQECGISHLMFEVLLILGRAGGPGMSMRAIAQERVLTTGGVTRLIDLGDQTAVRAARLHVQNVQRYFLDVLPAEHREQFTRDLRTVSLTARYALPRLR